MTNLAQRFITATIGAFIIIAAMLWNIYSLCAVLFILSLAVHIEYIRLLQHFKNSKIKISEWLLLITIGVVIFFSINGQLLFEELTIPIWLFIIPLLCLIFIYELYTKRPLPFQNISLSVTGLLYCIIPFSLLCYTALTLPGDVHAKRIADFEDDYISSWIILGYFFIVWSNDIFAFFVGKTIGKHKLFERISPNKTWEGFFGGMLASLACAYALSCFFGFLGTADWLAIGLIVAVFGTLGDLTESMLKRSVHIKDSSSILPGHGGFLDRFDATLIAAPMVVTWLMLRL